MRLDSVARTQVLLVLTGHAKAVAESGVILQMELIRIEVELAYERRVVGLDTVNDFLPLFRQKLQFG